MGESKIGIFNAKKMENKAIPNFFGIPDKGKVDIACVYNRDVNWLAGLSNKDGRTDFHIYRKGQEIEHFPLSKISQCIFPL